MCGKAAHYLFMKIKIEREVYQASRIMFQAVNNLILTNKLQELSKLIICMNYEILLQRKFHNLTNPIKRDCVIEKGFLRKSTEFFLKKSQDICETFDFACSSNIEFDSIRYLLKDLVDSDREDVICMLCTGLSLELNLQMEENNLEEIDLPHYLIPKEDKEFASQVLLEKIQELNDRYPDSAEETDDDMPF